MDNAPGGSAEFSVVLTVNGEPLTLRIGPWVTLLDLLRDELHLTGTKKGCDHGQCGACTVLIDGRRINSCLTLAVSRDGADIRTIEGMATGEALHPLTLVGMVVAAVGVGTVLRRRSTVAPTRAAGADAETAAVAQRQPEAVRDPAPAPTGAGSAIVNICPVQPSTSKVPVGSNP